MLRGHYLGLPIGRYKHLPKVRKFSFDRRQLPVADLRRSSGKNSGKNPRPELTDEILQMNYKVVLRGHYLTLQIKIYIPLPELADHHLIKSP
jgi:hypothetical protein